MREHYFHLPSTYLNPPYITFIISVVDIPAEGLTSFGRPFVVWSESFSLWCRWSIWSRENNYLLSNIKLLSININSLTINVLATTKQPPTNRIVFCNVTNIFTIPFYSWFLGNLGKCHLIPKTCKNDSDNTPYS
jgi:hypothetical protein